VDNVVATVTLIPAALACITMAILKATRWKG
jgi:hypothetical protein